MGYFCLKEKKKIYPGCLHGGLCVWGAGSFFFSFFFFNSPSYYYYGSGGVCSVCGEWVDLILIRPGWLFLLCQLGFMACPIFLIFFSLLFILAVSRLPMSRK